MKKRNTSGGQDREQSSGITSEALRATRKFPYELLGYLILLYLAPLLLRSTHESRCTYFILVSWCWWLLKTVSKPVAAIFPIAVFPIFDVLTVDQLYGEYFSLEGISLIAVLCLATVGDTMTTFIPRLAFHTCILFGVRLRRLFVVLSLGAFVGALFISNFIIAVAIMFIVDKVIRLAHKEAAKNLGNISSRRGSRRSVERLSVLSVDTDLLMARLASSVKSLHMVEEEKKKQLSKARRQRRSSSLKGGPQNATDAGKRVAPKRMHSRNTSPTRIKSNTLGTKPYKSAAQLGGKLNEPDAVERRRAEHSLDILMPPVMDKRRASVGFARLRGISIPSLGDTKETTQPGDKMADTAPVTKTSDIPGVPGRNRRPSIMKTCGLAGKRRSIQMHRRLSVLEFEAHMAVQDVKDAHQSSLDVGSQRKKKPHILSSLYGVPVTAQVGLSDKSVGDHIQLEDEYERIYLAARNAFLIAPTLMTVTGTWPSFWTQPAIGAFETYFPVLSIWRTPYMTTVVGILVLIGSLLSSTLGCIFLYAVNLHQLEPELEADLGPEVVQYASKKLQEVGPPRREELVFFCWLAAYSVCFVVRASLNVDASEGQMWILTMIMVMTSAFASLFNPDMMTRNVICGKMPWNVVVIFGGARAITRAFKVNNLVGVLFSFFDAEFWRTRSSIVSQIYLSTLSGILAEMINNATLSQLLMPVLFNIAATRDEHPLYYAIPVSLAASSNLILPISLPLIILHDTIDIPMQQLVVAGVTMKVIAVASTITFMNMMGNQFFRWSDDANPPTNLTHNDSTAYGISI